MLPAIGSVSALPGQGRAGIVVNARPIGDAENGRQLVALQIKQSQGSGEAGSTRSPADRSAPVSPAASTPSRSLERQDPAAPSAARLPNDLSAGERADVTRLQQRDQQVKQEEKAHAAVAGDLAGPINYVYQLGPDGRQYAVGGSVGIQAQTLSGNPDEAKRLAGRMAAAANAATNPSAQDYAAARQAYALGSQLGDTPSAADPRPERSLTL